MVQFCNCWSVGRAHCDLHGQPSLPGLAQPRAEARPLGFVPAVKPLVGHTGQPLRCGSSVVSDGQAMREALRNLVTEINALYQCPLCGAPVDFEKHAQACPVRTALDALEVER